MFQIILILILIIYIVFLLYKNSSNKQKNNSLEALKNGLLSYALLKTSDKDDVSSFNMNYKSYDGTKLPMFSGCSTSNACLSYIVDKDQFKKSFFYTKVMEDKITAIEKYLEKNFDTDDKIKEFFDMFIEKMDNKEESSDDDVQEPEKCIDDKKID